MLQLKYLTDEDIVKFDPIDIQSDEFQMMVDSFYGKRKGKMFVFESDGVPVLIIGLFEKWSRVFDSITIFSKKWKPVYYKSVIRKAKDYYTKIDCDRIEHMVNCERPWTCKMALAFGFEYVATFRKYYNGIDYKLYEIVK